MRKSGVYAAAAAMIGGAVVLFAPAPAAATVVSGAAAAATVETTLAEEVRHRRDHRSSRHRSWRYDRHRHGHRYSHRRPGFTYHYGGYYYANPWWLGPSVGFGVTVPVYPAPSVGMSAHVEWCINRYRSYDPHTDTYVPRVGVRARCNSPYR